MTQSLNKSRDGDSGGDVPLVRRRWFLPAAGAVAVLVVIILIMGLKGGGGDGPIEAVVRVSRGPLTISIVESGDVQAVRSENITNQVEGRSTIIRVVDEGTVVKKGDMLVELDSADLEEKLTSQEISYQNAKASFQRAVESLAIQKNLNESNVKAAELKVEFGKMDLGKYIEGDWPLKRRDAEIAITLAEARLTIAGDKYRWTEQLHKKEYVTENELRSDELSQKEAELSLEQKKAQLALLEKYEHPRQLKKLRSDYEEAIRELERVRRRSASELAQAEADLAAKKASFELQEGRRDKLSEQLAKTKILAPQDGLVVYATSTNWRGQTTQEAIEEGATVRHRQSLIVLPDLSSMKVKLKLHESVIKQVEMGMPAVVTIDAFPGERLQGAISKIAILPDPPTWRQSPDVRFYSAEVRLKSTPEGLKPGMNAKVEVLVAQLPDAVQVPVSAIFVIKGRQVCYVKKGGGIEARLVEVGLSNDRMLEIVSGLSEGETVYLYRPEGAPVLDVGEDEAKKSPWEKSAPEVREKPERETEAPAEEGEAPKRRPTPEQMEAIRKRLENATPEEREKMLKEMRDRGGRRGRRGEGRGAGAESSSGGGS